MPLDSTSFAPAKNNESAYESAYDLVHDLVQIRWPSDFVYDKKIEGLHVRYDFAYEFVYDLVSSLS
jgi:hypothetical protein